MLDPVKSGVGLSTELSFITLSRRKNEPTIAAVLSLLQGLGAFDKGCG